MTLGHDYDIKVVFIGVYLHIEQVELYWVPGIHILIRVEELSSEKQHLRLLDALLSQRPSMIQPIHC